MFQEVDPKRQAEFQEVTGSLKTENSVVFDYSVLRLRGGGGQMQ